MPRPFVAWISACSGKSIKWGRGIHHNSIKCGGSSHPQYMRKLTAEFKILLWNSNGNTIVLERHHYYTFQVKVGFPQLNVAASKLPVRVSVHNARECSALHPTLDRFSLAVTTTERADLKGSPFNTHCIWRLQLHIKGWDTFPTKGQRVKCVWVGDRS